LSITPNGLARTGRSSVAPTVPHRDDKDDAKDEQDDAAD
jgi:hypothetical protein